MVDPTMTRILVVDDTEGNRYATSRLLRRANFEVIEAETGEQALASISANRPDLVVLDVNLPDMTGFQVVERLRATADVAATPVLHLSASYTTNIDRARGLEQGADAYLTHPIDPLVFVATVRSLLRAGAVDRRLHDAAQEWQSTFDALGNPVLLLDQLAIVRRANRAACELLGSALGDAVGRSLGELFAARNDGEAQHLVDRILEGQPMSKVLFRIGSRSFHVTTDHVHDEVPQARTVCVLEDVSERIAAEREREALLEVAEEARRESEAANQSKNEFLAVMSHELRTPLNAIGGYAQLIELGIRGPVTQAQKDDLERIKRSQLYLLSLINDVLNFAKIESGHLHVEMDDVAIGDLTAGMSDFVQPQLQERHLSFSCDSDRSLYARADSDKVQQILINLLSNALKFTPAGGRIEMRCQAAGESVITTVRDTGLGIAREKLDTIFEPFVQVDRRYKREQEGIGLGLAISRELARAMEGELDVASEEGSGSTFTLRLRRAS